MTKQEVIDEITEIAGRMDQLTSSLQELYHDAEAIFIKIENLPTESSEIEEDVKEED
jgi:seryl-tRNA synthetase